jgi:type III secretory pathway component EscU
MGLATKEAHQPVVTMIRRCLSTTRSICYANCAIAEFGWRVGRVCKEKQFSKSSVKDKVTDSGG